MRHRSSDIGKIFWQHWQQYRDDLYRYCIKWIGNPTDVEDALSRAMLKALEKVQKYAAGEITNFNAWLTSLTRNLCVDIYRERDIGANRGLKAEKKSTKLNFHALTIWEKTGGYKNFILGERE